MKFEPVSYDHAARLIGKRPWDVSRDPYLLVSAHEAAMRTYGLNGCIVGVDIYNVEIEACGCEIPEPEGSGLPSPGTPPFERVEDLLSLEPDPLHNGRMPMVLDAAERIAERSSDAQVRIPLSGPFTMACALLGMENSLCKMAVNPEPLAAALLHLADNQAEFGRAALVRGLGISIFDSSVTPPLLSPVLFSERVLPSLERIMNGLSDGPSRDIQLIIGGDTVHILDSIMSISPSYIICPVETDQEEFMRRAADRTEVTIRINMDPSVFLPGRRESALMEAERAAVLADRRPNTVIGSLLPFDADPQIVSEIAEWVEHRGEKE